MSVTLHIVDMSQYHACCIRSSVYHRTSQYRRTLRNDLGDPVFDGVKPMGFRSGPMLFHFLKLFVPFSSYNVFNFSSFFLWVGSVRLGRTDRVSITLSILVLHCGPF